MILDAAGREAVRAAIDARMRALLGDGFYGQVCSGCGMPEDEWPIAGCGTCKHRTRRVADRDDHNRRQRAYRARRRERAAA